MQQLGTLREINENELELMLDWRNAESVRMNMYTQHEISKKEHLDWWEKIKNDPNNIYLMYEYAGIPQGIIGFTNFNRSNNNSSWAFYAAPDATKGTGSKMEFLALEYAFNTLKLHKLHCEVLAFNTPVIKLHEKFGFSIEGILKQHFLQDDKYIDIYKLGILSSDWDQQREKMKTKLERLSKSSK